MGVRQPRRRREERAGALTAAGGPPAGRVVRVVPDITGLDRSFDYLVPSDWGHPVDVGTMVRVELGPRRAAAWVVEVDVEPPPGVDLRPLAKWSGVGPPAAVVDLCSWAAQEWFGRRRVFLKAASPPRLVRSLPSPVAPPRATPAPTPSSIDDALAGGPSVLRMPPAADVFPVVEAAAARGDALVLVPSLDGARVIAGRLRQAGFDTALLPDGWARAASGGCVVVGTRAAAFAPLGQVAAVVVLDEHDEAHQEEGAPTWHARDVALERARSDGAPCVMVSPVPSLAALDTGRLVVPSRREERAGWPPVEVVDLRATDPAKGLLTEPLTRWLRSDHRVVVVVNRKGRATLLACAQCRDIATCERCGSSVTAPRRRGDDQPVDTLECRRCGDVRPRVCASCGSTKLKVLRAGVAGVAHQVAALVGEQVGEVTADGGDDVGHRVVVGTEAALHRVERAGVVAFLDFDQELLAPRHRAAEEALVLLARAARLVGGRTDGGRLVVQTHLPRHEVVEAALRADPGLLVAPERARRDALQLPPLTAIAEVAGPAASALIERLGEATALDIVGPSDGRWLVRAPDRSTLSAALAAAGRPPGRLRVAVNPLRL